MSNVYSLLEQVRARPDMYLGYDEEHRREQLQSLEMLLHGYSLALHLHGTAEPGLDLVSSFGRYLVSRFGWSMSCGPVAAILEESDTDQSAWDTWWRLLEEYRIASKQG